MKDRERLFTMACSDKTSGTGFTLEENLLKEQIKAGYKEDSFSHEGDKSETGCLMNLWACRLLSAVFLLLYKYLTFFLKSITVTKTATLKLGICPLD